MSWKILKFPTLKTPYATNGFLFTNHVQMKVNCHPETHTRGKWVNTTPYSKFVFECEPFGQIELPSGVVNSAEKFKYDNNDRYYFWLHIFVFVDASTGDCRLSLSTSNSINLAFYSETKNISVIVPVHQTVQDVQGFRRSMRDLKYSAVDQATGFVDDILNLELGSAIKRFTDASRQDKNLIDSAQKANAVTVSGNGAVGSYLSFASNLTIPKVHCYFEKFTEEYNVDKGRPLCKARTINTLSGFIKCESSSIESGLTQDENNMIESYMNGGFFYE